MAPLPKPSGNNAQNGGTSTPPPTEMGTLVEEEQLVIGALYWIEDERGDDVWASAEVLDHCEGHVMVQMTDSGARKEIDLDLEEMLPKNPAVVADMTALHHIHEPGILHNLKERARPWRQTPYTFMGTILLAVNPLKAVPMPPVEQFMDQPLDPETPHPYAIAELAYRQMRLAGGRAGTNQSIVVSGESGAGKTETVKIILSYLARRSKGADEDLEGRVLESSPLLESFGNARTLRNDNSSRFGKFLKLRFTSGDSSYLLGASVEPYLLEKSRVLSQGEGERNFHILYDLVAGALQSDLGEKLKLKGVSEYSILSSSGCTVLEGIDDADRFKAIQDAFTTVGVDSEAQLQVWQALSGVLHLSELQIEEADHEEGPVAAITDRETLSTVASMLGVEAQKLEEMLTLKVVPVTRGEVFTKRLGKTEAVRGRGAVVKSLYESMFLWVVRAINLALGGASKLVGDDKLPFIGLLDIFGFENFGHKNNLEQLLINYANESLQGDFNRQVFDNELRVYAEEGIEVSVSVARYTSSCLRMLTGKRDGVLPILDDVCSQPLPSDKRYLERLHLAFSRRQGSGVDVPEKNNTRDVYSRSSAGSDADDASAITSPGPNRKWGGGSETGFRGDLAGTDEEGGGVGGGRRRWDATPPTSRSSRGRAFGGDDGPNDGGVGGSSAGGSAFGRSGKWDRDKYGSEVGGSSTHSADDAVTEVRSLEWLGRGGALADDFRTEEHESFWVNHYASKVLYTVDGWVERNMDSVPQSFSQTMLTSTHTVVLDATTEFLADRMPDKDKDKEKRSAVDAPIPRKTSVRRELKTALAKRTVAGNFMASMNNLSSTLAATTCNFIRCIKPNAAMDFGIFDSQFVVEQLRCLGVLRTCEVLKLGMPTRVSYVDLKQSLGEGTLEAEKMFEGEPEKSLVAAILWAFDVPAEAFRLGAKRVFFRAGQISVLHKILNETPADKVPWVLSRLRLALANRRMAKIAAEEAEDSLAEAEAAVMEAEAISSNTRSGVSGSQQGAKAPLSPGSSADADMMALVATVEKARRAAKNAAQVKSIIKSAEAEGVGDHAPGAAEKIKASSEAALADIAKAAERADELEKLTTLGVFGVNGSAGSEKEMSSLRELHLAMRGIRNGLANVKKLWKSAEEAADKCQGNPAVVSAKQAKEKATEVVEKAKQVSENSKKAIDVARSQRRAKDVATRATERALKSFRSLQVVARQATLEEKRFRENPGLSAAADKGNASHSSSAPGSGLIQAAKAALAGTVAYESLTDAQKQQRAEEQKAASVEAAAAIAEAEKEEVQKREELAVLEKQRLQELEEEAAVAVAEGLALEERKEDGGEMNEARNGNPPSPSELPEKGSPRPKKVVVQAEPVEAFEAASSGDRDSLRPAPVQSFLAARKASPGKQSPTSGLGQEKASPGAWTSVSTKRAFSRQGSGGSAVDAVAAATAAVEAVTGMKSFTPRGAKEAVAREAAGTSAPGADTGWGEMVEEAGDGDGDGEVPASRAKATEAQVKAAHAKAKAAEAQIKAEHAHARARAAHAHAEAAGSEGHLGTTASTTIVTTGWGENGDQTGPGSIKDRLGTFTTRGKAAGNATSDESAATGRVHGRIGAALGSRSSPFQGAARTGGLERVTDSTNLDPVSETAQFGEQQHATDRAARANGAPASGVAAVNVGQETPLGWAAGRNQDSPDVAEKPLKAFAGINPAFDHHRNVGDADVNDRAVGDGNTYVDANDGRVQASGWGEDGDESAPGSVRDRLSAFSGSKSDRAFALGGIDKDGESAPFRRTASGFQAFVATSSDGLGGRNSELRAPGSLKGRLGAFSGKEGNVSSSSGIVPTSYRRAVSGGAVQDVEGTSGQGEVGDQADPGTKNHRGALASKGSNGTGSVVVTPSSGDDKALPYRQRGWGANDDQSAPRSIKNQLGAFSGSKDVTSPRHRAAPFADQCLTDSTAPSASGEGPSSLSCRSTVALDEATTSVRGTPGDGSPRKRSEGFSGPSLSPIAAAASRRGVNGVSGWGETGDQSAPGSVNNRRVAFTRASANDRVGPSDADGSSSPNAAGGAEDEDRDGFPIEGRQRRAPASVKDRSAKFSSRSNSSGGSFVGGDDGDENNTDAPMRSPSSLERSAPQALSALEHASNQGEHGDESGRLSSVRNHVGAVSGKSGGTPRSGRTGETGVGVGSKTSSPAIRSPPYGRGASGGSRSWVGRADEPAVQDESGGGKRGPGSVKDRLAAYSQRGSGMSAAGGGGRISPSGSRSPGSVGSADAMGSATAAVGDTQDSANGESRQKLASASSWSASVDRGASVSVKERLAAFSKKTSGSGSSSSIGSSAGGGSKINGVGLGLSKGDVRARFGAVPGSQSPSYNRGGAGGGSAETSLEKEGAVGGGLAKAAVGGRSSNYERGGGFSMGKSGRVQRAASASRIETSRSSQVNASSKTRADEPSTSSPSLDRPLSKKEEAIAALAAAEAEAAREEEEWTRKMRAVEEERRRVREERMKVAAEAVAIAERGEEGTDGENSLASVRTRTRRHERQVGEDVGGGRIRSGKRSMKKSGFPYGGGDGGVVGEEGSETSFEYDVGTSTAREIDGISEEEDEDDVDDDQEDEDEDDDRDDGEDDDVRPWPEAAMAAGGDDEEGGTMEAKKPMSSNGWHASPDVGPWRSPERAPEYGNNGSTSGSPKGGHPYARSKSFAGDPNRARHTAWDKLGKSGVIGRNHSMDDELGEQEEAMVSWTADPKKGEEGGEGGNVNGKGPVILGSMLFKDDAKDVGIVEARVMSINAEDKSGRPTRRAPKWNQYYFRLRDGVLTKSPARRSSFPGKSKESEDMNLTLETVTSYTNTKNCFCVRTGEVSWFLLGRSLADMKRWMHAINLQVRYIFQKEHGVHDDYRGQGRHGRFFYRMVEGSVPQWILTHPMSKAPRTGDGLFPGEVIEVTQVLCLEGSTFLRLANERGWTYARSPTNRSVLFEDLAGSVSEDTETYSFPSGSRGIVPILHGPGLRTQATGVTIQPGERALAAERFTPVDGTSIIFVKLADGRGWVPVKNNSYTPPNVLEGW